MKKIFEILKSLSGGTVLRTVLQILVYINQFIAVLGKVEGFADSMVYQIISVVVTLIVTAVSYWFNNNWSKAAQLAQDFCDAIKDGEITEEEAKELLAKYKGEAKDPVETPKN